ncbi:hypothetical protein DFJ73DRAFT_842570 [Zopfochytrium polystomum]|nr:hypothetical protein DFJ73DRAFT_842570 [Zopfochytrium polystomum]
MAERTVAASPASPASPSSSSSPFSRSPNYPTLLANLGGAAPNRADPPPIAVKEAAAVAASTHPTPTPPLRSDDAPTRTTAPSLTPTSSASPLTPVGAGALAGPSGSQSPISALRTAHSAPAPDSSLSKTTEPDGADDARVLSDTDDSLDDHAAGPDSEWRANDPYDSDNGLEYPSDYLGSLRVEKVLKGGYLKKKGEKRKTWKKRWFVLRTTRLAYYKNEKEYELLKMIPIADIHTVAPVELKKRVLVFAIITRQRTYYIQAESQRDMEAWISALRESQKEVEKMTGGPPPAIRTRGLSLAAKGGSTSAGAEVTSPSANAFQEAEHLNPNSSSSAHREVRVHFAEPGQTPQQIHAPRSSVGGSVLRTSVASALKAAVEPPLSVSFSADTESLESSVLAPSYTSSSLGGADRSADDTESQLSHQGSAFTVESLLTYVSTPSTTAHTPDITQNYVQAEPSAGGGNVGETAKAEGIFGSDGAARDTDVDANAEISSPPNNRQQSLSAVSEITEHVAPGTTSLEATNSRQGSLSESPHSSADSRPQALGVRFVDDPGRELRGEDGGGPSDSRRSGLRGHRQVSEKSPPLGSPSQRREVLSSSEEEEDLERGDESDSTINDNKVVFEGYLMKQGTKYKQSWKKRWFVLRNGKLTCYKNNEEYVVKRLIPLRLVLDVLEIDPPSRNHQFCFKVVLPKRNLILSASSAADMVGWIQALRAIHKLVSERQH